MLDLSESIRIVVDLNDIILVDAEYAAVGSASDLFTSFNGHLAVCLFDFHHFSESGHLKDLKNIRLHIYDTKIRMLFSEAEYDSQSRA